MGDLSDRHPVGYAIACGVLGGIVLGGYWWGSGRSFGSALLVGCGLTIVTTLAGYVMDRRQRRFFPPGLDRERRVAVRRIVRTGAAIEDPALAPAVAFHAGAILRVPHQPALFVAAAAMMGLAAVFFLVAALAGGGAQNVWQMGLFLVVAVVMLASLVSTARLRGRAAQAHERAQQLIATQG